jgi:hypothetical protein
MPKKLMKLEKKIEREYEKKGYSHELARHIGYGTIAKKFGYRRGQH